jgi:hypothetical protein
MSSKKKPPQTLADYLTIALSPVLIMGLVGSLVFFLLEVLYFGQYNGRMQWTLFFFVFGIVLIARISIEQGGGRAILYGIGLALVVWLALQAFVEYPPGSPVSAFRGAINFGLMAVAWWCAHRLTWDCTYIDESVDATGKGVLEAAGLDDRHEEEKEDGGSRIEDRSTEVEDGHAPRSFSLLAWWDRYCRYRQEQLRKPHTPGVWVVYFSLAALPLFGLGQSLIPAGELDRRRYAFWLMVCYVGSGLALLVTTSFLGLRRYLRQRKLKMPAAMTGIWMALGGALIVLMMAVGALLPRPYGEYQLIDSNLLASKDRNASRYAVLREGAAKGEGRPSSDKASREQDDQPGSGKQGDGKQGESGKGKSSGDKSGQGGRASRKQGNEQAAAKDGKSGGQDTSQGDAGSGNKSGEQRQGQTRSQQSNQNESDSRNPRDDQQKRQTGGPKLGKDDPGRESKTGQSNGKTTSLPDNPVSEVLQRLGWLGTVLKWVVFATLALVVLFFVLRSGLHFLANFTNWARQLLEALQAWWEGLLGRRESEPEAETDEVRRMPAPRPFASYANPFLDGRAEHLSPDALARYSFEALEAWASERSLGRQPEETPLEFAERLCTEVPKLEAEVRSLGGLYVRLAYARDSLTPACLGMLKRFWERLETIEERPVSV